MGAERSHARRHGAARIIILALLASFAALLPTAAAEAATVVDAGELTADVEAADFGLTLDGPGGSDLRQHPGLGTGPTGTLGFSSGGAWRHATRVVAAETGADGYRATLATNDPAGRTIELRLAQGGEGVISLDAVVNGPGPRIDALGMGFRAGPDERMLGFGERSNAVDQRGNTVENYVADGPYQDNEYPAISLFVPEQGLRERRDATYFPVPWLLSSAGYGVLVDNDETSRFRLGSDDPGAWSVEVVGAPGGEAGAGLAPPPERLQMRFFAGPTPADALRRFTAAEGRQPMPEAPWVYGSWYQGDQETGVAALREADAPVSVLQTYLHYLPCGDHQGREAEQPVQTAAAHDAGLAITTYFNPMVCVDYTDAYDAAVAADALTATAAGTPYVYRYGANPADMNIVSQYDFFKPAGRRLYGERLQEAIGHGYDGWMEDFGEYTPLDSRSGAGGSIPGTRAHNPYATAYHCAAAETSNAAGRPIVRFQRSGWTGVAPCADVVWGGDPTVGWEFDGLQSAVRQALSIGLSGISVWGSDIGGFFALGRDLSPELLTRWVQFGAVSAVMRTQRNGVAVPSIERPQVEDPEQIANWRRYAKLHTQLYPYAVAAQREYRRTGMPMMRHMALAYPRAGALAAREDQFMFGPDLLAAPVVTEGELEREVALPPGRWVDLWRSAAPREADGGLDLRRSKLLRGRRSVTLPAPLEELPLLVRAGAVLPLLPADVDTLANTDTVPDDSDIVGLEDREDSLELLAFPRGKSVSRFLEGERLRSIERKRGWKLRIRGERPRSYELQATLGSLRKPLRPCSVRLDGRRLPGRAWSFSKRGKVLEASFRTTDGVLEVERCGRRRAGR